MTQGIVNELITFLPVATAETLSPVLTYDDVETLRFLHKKAIPDNTLRAIATDLAYLEEWHLAATKTHLGWPASEDSILKFLAHHLYDPTERKVNERHGMPQSIYVAMTASGRLSGVLPHAPSTVRRRLSHWKRLHVAKGLDHAFDDPQIRAALKAACKASEHKVEKKSSKPITRSIIEKMAATFDEYRMRGRRDKALIYVGFSSGGRRRSELSTLRIEDVKDVAEDGRTPVFEIYLRTGKRIAADDGEKIIVSGRAARALENWLKDIRREFGDNTKGAIFRRINRWGTIGPYGISPGAINVVIKSAIKNAGLDPDEYSAHGLRSGFLTEARNQGVPLEDAMRHSKHRSYQVASNYYQAEDERTGKAVTLLD
ncbi:MAG: tyrosine-type recombinase/integrase [Pseudomonadota bacterium]